MQSEVWVDFTGVPVWCFGTKLVERGESESVWKEAAVREASRTPGRNGSQMQ